MDQVEDPHETLERVERAQQASEARERFGRRGAVVVGIMAALLAIATLAGNSAVTETILAQQRASDTWNEYQANSLKRHINEDSAILLRTLAAAGPQETRAESLARDLDQAVASKYLPNQDELRKQAQDLERERDLSERRHRIFQITEAALQLGIVLCSVAIVARAAPLLALGGLVGVVGLVLLADGLWLVAPLPF